MKRNVAEDGAKVHFLRPVVKIWVQHWSRPDTFFLLQLQCWVFIKVTRRHTEGPGENNAPELHFSFLMVILKSFLDFQFHTEQIRNC